MKKKPKTAVRSQEQLEAHLKRLAPQLLQAGLDGFVIIGWRPLPEAEQARFGGATEVLYWNHSFPDQVSARVLVKHLHEQLERET